MVKQLDIFKKEDYINEQLYKVSWKEYEDLGIDMLTGRWRGVSDKIVTKTTIRKMTLDEANGFVNHLETFVRYYLKNSYQIIPQ